MKLMGGNPCTQKCLHARGDRVDFGGFGYRKQCVKKSLPGASLNNVQRRHNHQKSKIRAMVQNVFGFMENPRNRTFLRCIGIKKATLQIGLANLAYNICRYVQLTRLSRGKYA